MSELQRNSAHEHITLVIVPIEGTKSFVLNNRFCDFKDGVKDVRLQTELRVFISLLAKLLQEGLVEILPQFRIARV